MKEDKTMKIGERIKCLRESKGMSQRSLAEAIHVSPSFMNRMENGSSTPSIEYICNIAKVLDVTPQDVLCDIFVYTDDDSTAEQIKTIVEKFSPDRQLILLDTLKLIASRLDLL